MIERVDAAIRVKRGTNAERLSAFLSAGEVAYTTDTQRLYVGNDTVGGRAADTRITFNNLATSHAIPGDFYVDTLTNGITQLYVLTGSDYTQPSNYVFLANNNADSVYTLVQNNSAFWGVQGGQTGGIAYTTLTANSANWNYAYVAVQVLQQISSKKYSRTIGDGITTSFTITHNFNTRDVTTTVYDVNTNEVVFPSIQYTSLNTITVNFNTAPAYATYRVVVVS